MSNHLPPQNLEAEEAAIGAALKSQTALEAVQSTGITVEDFYRPSHRTIWEAVTDLADRTAVDELTVVNHLRSKRQLSEIGGSAVVLSLAERAPAVANAKLYAVEVRDQATLRRLVETGHAIAQLGYDHPKDPEELVADAGMLVDQLASAVPTTQTGVADDADGFSQLSDEWLHLYDDLAVRAEQGGVMVGLPTGLKVLDERIGGWQPGRLYIVAARPGMGKSAFAGQTAEAVVYGSDTHVAVLNLEMSKQSQAGRAAARAARMNVGSLTTGTPRDQDWERLQQTMQSHHEGAKRLHMLTASNLRVAEACRRVRRLHRRLKRKGHGLGLVVVDYLQLLEPSSSGKQSNRTNDISEITRRLKALAMELGVPVIALSQLSRAVEQRPDKVPMLSDLRESGSIEQDADVVLFLYRPEVYLREQTPEHLVGRCKIDVAKWRDGEPGVEEVGWIGWQTRFVETPAGRVPGAGAVA